MKRLNIFVLGITIVTCLTGCSKEAVEQIVAEEAESFVDNISGVMEDAEVTITVNGETYSTSDNTETNDIEEEDNSIVTSNPGSLLGDIADSVSSAIVDKIQNSENASRSKDIVSFKINGEYVTTGPVDDINDWTPQSMSIQAQKMYEDIFNDAEARKRVTRMSLNLDPIVIAGNIVDGDISPILLAYYILEDAVNIVESEDDYIDNDYDNALVKWSSIDDAYAHFGFTRDCVSDTRIIHYFPNYIFVGEDEYDNDWHSILNSDAQKLLNGINEDNSDKFVKLSTTVGEDLYWVIIPQSTCDFANSSEVILYSTPAVLNWTEDHDGYWMTGVKERINVYIDLNYLVGSCTNNVNYIKDIPGINYADFPGVIIRMNDFVDNSTLADYLLSIEDFNWTDYFTKYGINLSDYEDSGNMTGHKYEIDYSRVLRKHLSDEYAEAKEWWW